MERLRDRRGGHTRQSRKFTHMWIQINFSSYAGSFHIPTERVDANPGGQASAGPSRTNSPPNWISPPDFINRLKSTRARSFFRSLFRPFCRRASSWLTAPHSEEEKNPPVLRRWSDRPSIVRLSPFKGGFFIDSRRPRRTDRIASDTIHVDGTCPSLCFNPDTGISLDIIFAESQRRWNSLRRDKKKKKDWI